MKDFQQQAREARSELERRRERNRDAKRRSRARQRQELHEDLQTVDWTLHGNWTTQNINVAEENHVDLSLYGIFATDNAYDRGRFATSFHSLENMIPPTTTPHQSADSTIPLPSSGPSLECQIPVSGQTSGRCIRPPTLTDVVSRPQASNLQTNQSIFPDDLDTYFSSSENTSPCFTPPNNSYSNRIETTSGSQIPSRMLSLTVRTGATDIARSLILGGANVNSPDDTGTPPIHLAVKCRRLSIVALLLSHDADVDATDSAGRTPLELAVMLQDGELVQLLVENGAKVT